MKHNPDQIKQVIRQRGFTLVELVTVITIMAIVAAYITVRLGGTSDDAKLAIARTVLLKDIPESILAVRSRNGLNCRVLEENGVVAGISDVPDTVANVLVNHGANRLTPWGDTWRAGYHHITRTITVAYPVLGVSNLTTMTDLVASLLDESVIAWVDTTMAIGTVAGSPAAEIIGRSVNPVAEDISTLFVGYRCI